MVIFWNILNMSKFISLVMSYLYCYSLYYNHSNMCHKILCTRVFCYIMRACFFGLDYRSFTQCLSSWEWPKFDYFVLMFPGSTHVKWPEWDDRTCCWHGSIDRWTEYHNGCYTPITDDWTKCCLGCFHYYILYLFEQGMIELYVSL